MKDKKPLFLLLVSVAVIALISGVIVMAAPAIKKMINQEMVNEKLHSQIATFRQSLPQAISEKFNASVALGSVYFDVDKFESREELDILINELFKMPDELVHNAIIMSGTVGKTIACSFIPPDYNNITNKKAWVLTVSIMKADNTVDTCDVIYYDRSGTVVEKTQHQGKSLGYFDFIKKSN